jgi:hypothetical protein
MHIVLEPKTDTFVNVEGGFDLSHGKRLCFWPVLRLHFGADSPIEKVTGIPVGYQLGFQWDINWDPSGIFLWDLCELDPTRILRQSDHYYFFKGVMADFVFSQSDPWWPNCESDWAQFGNIRRKYWVNFVLKLSFGCRSCVFQKVPL